MKVLLWTGAVSKPPIIGDVYQHTGPRFALDNGSGKQHLVAYQATDGWQPGDSEKGPRLLACRKGPVAVGKLGQPNCRE